MLGGGISLALATAGGALALLLATLAGLWIGFRIAVRDSAMLASTAREAASAMVGAKAAMQRCDAMEEGWALQVQRVERMRASSAASASKAEQARERAAARETEDAAPPAPADINDRRRAVQRRLTGGSR